MTYDRLDKLISKILDSPEGLTVSEIEDITHDEYLRKIYDTAVLLKSATEPSGRYNLDQEWKDFQTRLKGNVTIQRPHKRLWLQAAAIFIGVLLIGCITLLFFRVSKGNDVSDPIVNSIIDTIQPHNAMTMASVPLVYTADTQLKGKELANTKPSSTIKNPKAEKAIEHKTEETTNAAVEKSVFSINQALYLTEDDCMMAQMFLTANYDIATPETPSSITTVNYGDSRQDNTSQPSWLSEIMKYSTGLTVNNLMIQRGSANILYQLTFGSDLNDDISPSDRATAFSTIKSIVDEGICENDPLIDVLVAGSLDNLKQ